MNLTKISEAYLEFSQCGLDSWKHGLKCSLKFISRNQSRLWKLCKRPLCPVL